MVKMVIPGVAGVDRALANVERRIQLAIRKINRQAAGVLAKGDYDGAASLVEIAKNLRGFEGEIQACRSRWTALTKKNKAPRKTKAERSALWAYYQPILRCLVEIGDQPTRATLESALEKRLSEFAKPGDLQPMPSGVVRWKVMLRRAKKPMTAEGFLDAKAKGRWRITTLGRRAAEKGPVREGRGS